MDLRDKLKKAAGLFVVIPEDAATPKTPRDPGEPGDVMDEWDRKLAETNRQIEQLQGGGGAKTVEQIVRDTEGPNLDEIQVPATATPPLTPDGLVDFAQVYQQAKIPPVPFSAEKTLEMLASLPQNLPLDTRRQTVSVTLGAMGQAIGATPETIVADASRKMAALAAYTESISHQAAKTISSAELEIAALQSQVEAKRREIESTQVQQRQVAQACEAEADHLDDVLEFFSLDVAPSKHATADPPK